MMFAYFVRILILRAPLNNDLVDSFAWILLACYSLGLLVIPQESLAVRYEFFCVLVLLMWSVFILILITCSPIQYAWPSVSYSNILGHAFYFFIDTYIPTPGHNATTLLVTVILRLVYIKGVGIMCKF